MKTETNTLTKTTKKPTPAPQQPKQTYQHTNTTQHINSNGKQRNTN